MKLVDITAVVTFHNEGLMAHRSLVSIFRCCQHAELAGLTTRIVATLDNADPETRRVIRRHPCLRPHDKVIDLSFGDISLSRNHAIQESESRCVGIFDGDDHISQNWLAAALRRLDEAGRLSIVRPQLVITFDATSQLREQPDQSCVKLDVRGLLATNFWNVCAVATRDTFLAIPYVSTGTGGFGFEDWHWNCETIAAGYQHVTAPRTIYFERHKRSGSLNRMHQSAGAVIRSSKLFGEK